MGESVQVRPVDGEMLVVRATAVSVRPFSDVTVIVEFPVPPVTNVTVVGLADIAKSWTTKVTLAE